MAESTRVSDTELERREKYLRNGIRQRELMDPFTWSYPAKGASVMFGVSVAAAHITNMWNKKPFYYALFPRMALVGVITALGYGLGALRERHYQTRDAVIQHYIELHPEDFDHFKDRNGRPFSQVLLPWYPRRTAGTSFLFGFIAYALLLLIFATTIQKMPSNNE